MHEKPALKPTHVSQLAARSIEQLLREGQSDNTMASYRAALRYWAAWFALRYGAQLALPLPALAVMQFVVDHVQRTTPDGLTHDLPQAIDRALVTGGYKGRDGPMALSTLEHRLAVLSKAHLRSR